MTADGPAGKREDTVVGADRGTATAGRGEDSGREAPELFPSPRRRQLLRSVAAPAAATALSGCSVLESGDDPLVDLEPGDTVGYGGAVRFGEAYTMTVTSAADGETTLTGRFRGENRYIRLEEAEESVESYLVDGDGYVVVDGECTVYPDLDAGLRGVGSVEPPDEGGAGSELTVTGTDEVDGSAVFVLERDGAEDGPTYYVDRETQHLRRIETGASVVDYGDWGAVDPIQAPDGDCREGRERTTTPE